MTYPVLRQWVGPECNCIIVQSLAVRGAEAMWRGEGMIAAGERSSSERRNDVEEET